MRASSFALALVLVASLPSAPAAAKEHGGTWRAARSIGKTAAKPFVFLGAWGRYNRSVDRDERLSLVQFGRFVKKGVKPARVAPGRVLETKIGRAEYAVGMLQLAAAKGAGSHALGYPGALNEMFDGAFTSLNKVSALVYDAWSYSSERNLSDPRIRRLARDAVTAMQKHMSSEPRGGNSISEFGATFQGAKQSYKDLSAIADGSFQGYHGAPK